MLVDFFLLFGVGYILFHTFVHHLITKRMKRHYLLFLFLWLSTALWAGNTPVSQQDAERVAKAMMNQMSRRATLAGKKSAKQRAAQPRLAYAARTAEQQDASLYVFNNGTDGGFVIVAGDQRASSPVLGYCDQGCFDYEKAPDNLRCLLATYAAQIEQARASDQPVAQSPRKAQTGTPVVGPLLRTQWNQDSPWNDLCPDPDTLGMHCAAGCVPIAMAQVMNYHKWPERGHNKHGYYYQLYMEDLNAYWKHKWIEVDFYQSVYDWEHMETSGAAMARLVYDCGVASEAKYGYDKTPAYMDKVQEGLRKFFSYKGEGLRMVSADAEGENFDVLLREELDNHRPVILAGQPAGDGDGHAFVCDGYDDAGFFHMNLGWGGQYDGYYLSTAVTVQKPGIIVVGGPEYVRGFLAIIGIQPNNPEGHDVDGLVYELQANGEARLLYGKNPGEVNIPDEVVVDGKSYPVTSIAPYAFYERTDITGINLPQYLREVDDFAFYGCNSQNEIGLPQRWSDDGSHLIGIERIGDYAFSQGTYASSKKIFDFIPSTLTHIGEGAFEGARINGTLQLLNMEKIGDKAFSGCSIDRLVIAGKVREIGKEAFASATIEQIDFQPSVRKIGDNAFDYCRRLGNGILRLPESVREIGREAFRVTHLKEIHIPKHVWSIGENALHIIPVEGFVTDENSSSSIFVDEENPTFASSGGMLFNKFKTRLITCPPSQAEVSIPRVTSEVAADAFYHPYVTRSLTIPSSVKTFEDNSFVNINTLTDVYNYGIEPQPLPDRYTRWTSFTEPLTIHVLRGKKAAFEAAEGWNKLTIVDDLMAVDDRIFTVLTVYLKDGSQHEFKLFDQPQITFQGGDLCIKTKKNEMSFAMSDVSHYNFEKGYFDAIEDAEAATEGLIVKDNEVAISHLPEGTLVSVYALDGKLMCSATVPASGVCSVSLHPFPTGVYVVKANDVTYKIMKR